MQEQPHFKRSALWQRERQITAWLQEGYSFRQIADELTREGTKVSTRWLQEWYAKNVGRRRTRTQTDSGANPKPPGNSSSPPPRTPTGKPPGKNPSPTPPASTTPADRDVSALFQSQFKRPRK